MKGADAVEKTTDSLKTCQTLIRSYSNKAYLTDENQRILGFLYQREELIKKDLDKLVKIVPVEKQEESIPAVYIQKKDSPQNESTAPGKYYGGVFGTGK